MALDPVTLGLIQQGIGVITYTADQQPMAMTANLEAQKQDKQITLYIVGGIVLAAMILVGVMIIKK
jgi:ATP-dependent protease ClpP protease subunit